MKNFICIYCGREKKVSESSNEHVIPRYLYGKLIIREVCEECNNLVGERIETWFTEFIKYAKYLKTGITETKAKTIIDGCEIEGFAKIIDQKNTEKPYKLISFVDKNNNQLKNKTSSIEYIAYEFDIKDFASTIMPGIFKIGFSALHYFLNYRDNKRQYLDFVDCPELGNMRLSFNPQAQKGPENKLKELEFQALDYLSRNEVTKNWTNQEIRRNFIEIKKINRDTVITIVLLSDWAYKIIIKEFSIPKEEFVYEDLLPKLNKLCIEDRRKKHEMTTNAKRINMHITF